MTDLESSICVGGPHSGRHYLSVRDENFTCPVRRQKAAEFVVRGDEPKQEIVHVTYVRQEISTPDGSVSFWVPEGQTPLETMTLLLERFRSTE